MVSVRPTMVACRPPAPCSSAAPQVAWALGVVIYAGHETKVFCNQNQKRKVKRTSMERDMMRYVVFMFVLLLILCFVGALVSTVQAVTTFSPEPWYLRTVWTELVYLGSGWPVAAFFRSMCFWAILLSVLIPISLTISIDMVRVVHKFAVQLDRRMRYRDPSGTIIPAMARTSNLSEELGRIDAIFSDKTGTLTCNRMDFLKCAVAPGTVYGTGTTEIARLKELAARGQEPNLGATPKPPPDDGKSGNRLNDPRLSDPATRAAQPNSAAIGMFMRILAVCHTVRLRPRASPQDPIELMGESPDELALVTGAAAQGYQLVEREDTTVSIEVDGRVERYEVLNLIQFSSLRKRMSCVVRCPGGELRVFVKGADSIIMARLAASDTWRQEANAILNGFSRDGLRTLCIAQRLIAQAEYTEWDAKYKRAAMDKNAGEDWQDALGEDIERDLELVGCSGIEDKLQHGVPMAVRIFRAANIKLWVPPAPHTCICQRCVHDPFESAAAAGHQLPVRARGAAQTAGRSQPGIAGFADSY